MKVKEYMIDEVEFDILHTDHKLKEFLENIKTRKYVKPHADRIEIEDYLKAFRIKRKKLYDKRVKLINSMRKTLEVEFWEKRREGDALTEVILNGGKLNIELSKELEKIEKRGDRLALLIWDRLVFNPCPPTVSFPCCECTGFYEEITPNSSGRRFLVCTEDTLGSVKCVNYEGSMEDKADGRTMSKEFIIKRGENERD